MARILVAGVATGVGKTLFSSALVQHLRSGGHKAGGFKPTGGCWLFKDPAAAHRCLAQGRIYGGDCTTLKQAMGGEIVEELVGPTYRIMGPDYDLHGVEHGQQEAVFAARATVWNGSSPQHTVMVDESLIRKAECEALFEAVVNSGATVMRIASQAQYAQFIPVALAAIESANREMSRRYEILVIESHSGRAHPSIVPLSIDFVIVVNLGVVALYDGTRYLEICRQLSESTKPRAGWWTALAAIYSPVLVKVVVQDLAFIKRVQIPPCLDDTYGRSRLVEAADQLLAGRLGGR